VGGGGSFGVDWLVLMNHIREEVKEGFKRSVEEGSFERK